MIERNTLFDIISPPRDQPNLTIQEVLNSLNSPLEELPFTTVNNSTNLGCLLQNSVSHLQSNGKSVHILMVPLDKEGVTLDDSHCHK